MTSSDPATITDPHALADRLQALSTALRQQAAQRPAYEPSSCASCIAACRNFVRLTYGLREFNGNAPDSTTVVTRRASIPWRRTVRDEYGRPIDVDVAVGTGGSTTSRREDDQDWTLGLWRELNAATRGMWDMVSETWTSSAAVYDYKMCLADCIDDQAKVYSAAVTSCVQRASSESDLAACERIARESEEFRRLEGEVRRLEAQVLNSTSTRGN
ncbi:hypothetical protein GGF31_003954 [Allomyces arbusculus]|nr:hypothetical protein GGF31_003954 [Allomyces arbusculus]